LHVVKIEDLMDLDALKHLETSEELLVLFRRLGFEKVGHILDSQDYIKHYLDYFRCSQEAKEKFKELIKGLRLEANLR
jgi:L-amino acid N-acyltransferase YncA